MQYYSKHYYGYRSVKMSGMSWDLENKPFQIARKTEVEGGERSRETMLRQQGGNEENKIRNTILYQIRTETIHTVEVRGAAQKISKEKNFLRKLNKQGLTENYEEQNERESWIENNLVGDNRKGTPETSAQGNNLEGRERQLWNKLQGLWWRANKYNLFNLIRRETQYIEENINLGKKRRRVSGRSPRKFRLRLIDKMGEEHSVMDTEDPSTKVDRTSLTSETSTTTGLTTEGGSQSTANATANAQQKYKLALDQLLLETALVNLNEGPKNPKVRPLDIPPIKGLLQSPDMEENLMEEDLEELRENKMARISKLTTQTMEWLKKFEENHEVYLRQSPGGLEMTAKLVEAITGFNEEVVLEQKSDYWQSLVPILIRMVMTIKDMADRQNATATNLANCISTVTRSFELINEQLVLMSGSRVEIQHEPEILRRDYDQLDVNDKATFNIPALSIGRDAIQNDPLCLSTLCAEFTLPGLTQEQVRHLESENFRQEVMKDRKCFCIDQALLYRKAAIYEHDKGYDTISRLRPGTESATWLGRGGLNIGKHTKEKDEMYHAEALQIVIKQTHRIIVQDDALRRHICAAVLHVYHSVPEIGEPIKMDEEKLSRLLRVAYCGTKGEYYTTGWLKGDAQHKLENEWRGENALGSAIRKRILLSWKGFIEWYNTLVEIDELMVIRTVFEQAKLLANIWSVSGNNFAETKIRVQTMGWGKCGSLPTELKKEMARGRRSDRREEEFRMNTSIASGEERTFPTVTSDRSAGRTMSYKSDAEGPQKKSLRKDSAGGSSDNIMSEGQISQSHGGHEGGRGGFQDFYNPDRGAQGYSDPRPPPPVQPPRWDMYRGRAYHPTTRRWEYGQSVQMGGAVGGVGGYMPPNVPSRFVTPIMPPPGQTQPGSFNTMGRGGGRQRFRGQGKGVIGNYGTNWGNIGYVEFQEFGEDKDPHSRESSLSSGSISASSDERKRIFAKSMNAAVKQSGNETDKSHRQELPRPRSSTPNREPGATLPGNVTQQKKKEMGPKQEKYTAYKVPVNLDNMLMVADKTHAHEKAYFNSVDEGHTVNITRCNDWKATPYTDLRFGNMGRKHCDPEVIEIMHPDAHRIKTWKGPRIRTSPFHPRRIEEFKHVPVPYNFSFRYLGLDEYLSEIKNAGVSWPIVEMGYIGDSTIIRLRQWTQCWSTSHRNTEGAIRFAPNEAHHFAPSKNLYALTDFQLESQFKECDIIVIKPQIDLFETWFYLSNTIHERESLESIILDIRYLIEMIRAKNATASIIVVGMNPVNIPGKLPARLEKDVMAVDFSVKVDILLQDMVNDKYDCSLISVVNQCLLAGICEKPFFDTLHMGPMVNMVISREIYTQIHNISLCRIRKGLPVNVPPFRTPVQGAPLSSIMDSLDNDQKKYIEIYKLN